MTYIEWKQELSDHLISLTKEEREKVFAYYAEMYADKRDAGISDKEIILGFGAPYDVAKRILNENYDENLEIKTNLNDIQNNSTNKRANPYSKNGEYGNNLNSQTSPPLKNNKPKKKGSAGKIVAIVLLAILGGLILISAIRIVIAFIYAPEFIVKEYKTLNEVTKIEIDGLPGDIKTEFYEGNELIINYPYDANYGYEISENGEVLSLGHDEINWFWLWEMPETVIKIPNGVVLEIVAEIDAGSFSLASGEYKNINLDLDAGEIFIGDICCWTLNCSVDAGEIKAGDISCTNAIFDVDAGEIEADKIICTIANVDVDAGGVEIENLDCDTLEIEVDAGGAKIKTATVNHINASVNAGSIEIDMTGVAEEYSVFKEVSAGSCNLSSQQGTTDKAITVNVNAGSVTIRFPIIQAEKVNSFGNFH